VNYNSNFFIGSPITTYGSLGEVMNAAALPSGLKLSSESMVQLHPSFNLDESTVEFSDKGINIMKTSFA
jgi:primosomal protein N' (replication factor Y)